MRIHTKEKPFKCKECSKKFRTQGHIKEHMNRHKKFSLFLCEICSAKFSRKNYLKRHETSHHKFNNYEIIHNPNFHCNENEKNNALSNVSNGNNVMPVIILLIFDFS
jgi:uncharacterized Zn-finger protein